MNITTLLLTRDCPYTFVDIVPLDVIPHLETLLQTRFYMDRISRKAYLQWRTWTVEHFCYEPVPDTAIAPHSSVRFYVFIAKLPVQFDLENEAYELLLDSN